MGGGRARKAREIKKAAESKRKATEMQEHTRSTRESNEKRKTTKGNQELSRYAKPKSKKTIKIKQEQEERCTEVEEAAARLCMEYRPPARSDEQNETISRWGLQRITPRHPLTCFSFVLLLLVYLLRLCLLSNSN